MDMEIKKGEVKDQNQIMSTAMQYPSKKDINITLFLRNARKIRCTCSKPSSMESGRSLCC